MMNLRKKLLGAVGIGMFVLSPSVQAALVTPVVKVNFDGNLSGTTYALGAGEIDTTGTFQANGAPTLAGGQATNNSDGDGFYFDSTSVGDLTTQSWVSEIVMTPNADAANQGIVPGIAHFLDVQGDLFFRYNSGTVQFGYWDGATEPTQVVADFAMGTPVHLALTWDASTNTLEAFVDGASVGAVSSGNAFATPSPNVGYSFFARTGFFNRTTDASYTAVSFATFTGTFDPANDFVIPEPASLALLSVGALMMLRRRQR